MACASPAADSGSPTTRRPGFHSATSDATSSKRVTAPSGWAVRSSGSPTAIPIRFRPKSKARTVRPRRSGMSRFILQPREVEAEELHRRRQPLLGRSVEQDAVARLDREPGVLRQLVLELARGPARVAERDEQLLRALAAAHRFEYVLRGGKADMGPDPQRRLPVA